MTSCLVSAVLILIFSACTHTVRQSQDLSDIGIKYTDAIKELIDVTTDTVIDDDSDNLLYTQQLTSYDDKVKEKKELEKRLKEHDKVIEELVTTLGRFRGQTNTLKAYFINLQSLSRTDAPESAANAVAELSTSINYANANLRERENLIITDEQKKAFSSTAGLVAKGFQSANLQKALKRDAPIISEQLYLHEKLIEKLSRILKHSAKIAYINEWKLKVLKPYKNKEIINESNWKKERKQLLKSTFFETSLDNAKNTAKQMRLVWGNILENKTDLESVGLLINDINEMTAALHQLKQSFKEAENE